MADFIRPRSRPFTALTPHVDNPGTIIPNRNVPPFWTAAPAPSDGSVGIEYKTYGLADVLEGGRPMTAILTAGTLPAGLVLSGTKIIGTPTQAGLESGLEITANNAVGVAVSATFNIEIFP